MNAMAQGKAFDAPLSDLLPGNPFDEKTVKGLQESFRTTQRQISPLLVRPDPDAGKLVVIAGNNRLEAAKRENWPTLRVEEVPYDTEEDKLYAELLTLDENDRRKDVTPVDRAIHDSRRAEIYDVLFPDANRQGGDQKSAEAKSLRQLGEVIEPQETAVFELKPTKAPKAKRTSKAIADQTNRPERTVQRNIARGKLPKAVLTEMKGYRHLNVGKELDAMLDLDGDRREQVLAAARNGKKLKASTVLKQEQRRLKEIALAGKQKGLPAGKFGVLYLDPPWSYKAWDETGEDHTPAQHYPVQDLDALKAFPVGDLGHADSVMFMWARGDMLDDAMTLMHCYGYEYRAVRVWKKPRRGRGHVFRDVTEFLLYGVRGKPPGVAPGKQVDSLFEAPQGRHSEKPEEAYRMIEAYFPTMSKVELYQRGAGKPARKGWTVWGYEASDNVEDHQAEESAGEAGGDLLPAEIGAETPPAVNPEGEPRSEEAEADSPAPDAPVSSHLEAGTDRPSETAATTLPHQRTLPDSYSRPSDARLAADAKSIDRNFAALREMGFDPVPMAKDRDPKPEPRELPNFHRSPDVAKPKLPTEKA